MEVTGVTVREDLNENNLLLTDVGKDVRGSYGRILTKVFENGVASERKFRVRQRTVLFAKTHNPEHTTLRVEEINLTVGEEFVSFTNAYHPVDSGRYGLYNSRVNL